MRITCLMITISCLVSPVVALSEELTPQAEQLTPQAPRILGQTDPSNPTYLACEIGVDDYHYGIQHCGNFDAVFPCGNTAQQIGQRICNIMTPQGPISVPSTVNELSDIGGGQCGYATFSVTCHIPAGNQIIYNTRHDGPLSRVDNLMKL
jgi:hypothetical protein